MNEFITISYRVLGASWEVLQESAPFVLLGFFVAALMKAFLPDSFVSLHLGGKGIGSILKASAFGIPIPLCSCGVLPAAAGLRKQGAGKGAVASFLISTPETGVDSIAVSYALLDPLMTVVRPLAGFITAVCAGVAVSFSERFDSNPEVPDSKAKIPDTSCTTSCCCDHSHPVKQTFAGKFRDGMTYAFNDLLKDVGAWLFAGILLAGLISVFVSPETLDRYLSNEFLSMAVMFALSVPLYVCATASTPIAAALALKGISPGAALVFLLAGPATNVASLTVISKILGRKSTTVYVIAIIVISFLAGILVNHLYIWLGFDIRNWVVRAAHEEHGPLALLSSIVLIVLVLKSMLPAKHAH